MYPGTAVARMLASRERAAPPRLRELGKWEASQSSSSGRRACATSPTWRPAGYTGHAFNDANHCDATTMLKVSHNLSEAGKDRVAAIAVGNRLGPGIEVASLPELGEAAADPRVLMVAHGPPRDVARRFRSRIAFKLVWCPPTFETFVLVDDDDALLATGCPTGQDCPTRQRGQLWPGARLQVRGCGGQGGRRGALWVVPVSILSCAPALTSQNTSTTTIAVTLPNTHIRIHRLRFARRQRASIGANSRGVVPW